MVFGILVWMECFWYVLVRLMLPGSCGTLCYWVVIFVRYRHTHTHVCFHQQTIHA